MELFLDPALRFPKLRIARRLLQKKLGFRMLMDVIPLEATLVKGSHGICPASVKDYPLIIVEKSGLPSMSSSPIAATDVYRILCEQVLA